MGANLVKMEQNIIAPFAFHAPTEPTYASNAKHLKCMYTIKGDRIVTSFKSHKGDSDRYWEPGLYNRADEHLFIIFSHGNADDIGGCQDYMQWLATNWQTGQRYSHSKRRAARRTDAEESLLPTTLFARKA